MIGCLYGGEARYRIYDARPFWALPSLVAVVDGAVDYGWRKGHGGLTDGLLEDGILGLPLNGRCWYVIRAVDWNRLALDVMHERYRVSSVQDSVSCEVGFFSSIEVGFRWTFILPGS
ncbi:hypothetical protein D7Z54_29545 [Salibacterium salarium]|uniref:Uncharacterized protein n=1 Tax=Salibacterium salarium TaxID=284579 RepID=A0A3R9PFT9_9BACI|nr:hypothetical protein D7Z54_29545 [Salibacterium salarium]